MYYRVSTVAQGRSGLGLEAQQFAVESLCASRGWNIITPPFTEIESGKCDDRPELAKAFHRAKVTGSTLVVAKLDRLSRNVAFLATLQESGVKFIAADKRSRPVGRFTRRCLMRPRHNQGDGLQGQSWDARRTGFIMQQAFRPRPLPLKAGSTRLLRPAVPAIAAQGPAG